MCDCIKKENENNIIKNVTLTLHKTEKLSILDIDINLKQKELKVSLKVNFCPFCGIEYNKQKFTLPKVTTDDLVKTDFGIIPENLTIFYYMFILMALIFILIKIVA